MCSNASSLWAHDPKVWRYCNFSANMRLYALDPKFWRREGNFSQKPKPLLLPKFLDFSNANLVLMVNLIFHFICLSYIWLFCLSAITSKSRVCERERKREKERERERKREKERKRGEGGKVGRLCWLWMSFSFPIMPKYENLNKCSWSII